jgi:3-hydroxybutyryl-CoA dehydrogenase
MAGVSTERGTSRAGADPRQIDVSIIGAGTMGHALAMVFLAAGKTVALHDVSQASLRAGEARIWGAMTAWQGEDAVDAAHERLITEPDFLSAASAAGIVIEAVIEDLELKRTVFHELDRAAQDDAVLCTNTSALPVAQVTAQVVRTDRVLGTHWFNPPHLVPGVEIVRGPHTSDAAVDRVVKLLRAMDKVPVEVPDVPGFIANRLQMALVKEAILCVDEGLMAPADLDRIFQNSIGFRLPAAGPLAVADFAGLDVYLSVFETLEASSSRFAAPEGLRRAVQEGRLGAKSGKGFLPHDSPEGELAERDARLLALAGLRTQEEWRRGGSKNAD